jgi:Tfp pilus assembly protein PilO
MAKSNRLIIATLLIAAIAVGFWILLLAPKREEANELASEVEVQQSQLDEARSNLAGAEAARREFPADYRQLVVLGQAVPEGDETSSLLVELNHVASEAEMGFESIQLAAGTEIPAPAPAPTAPAPEAPESGAVPAAATVPPTEAAAALLPLGASIGPAGLAVMPYSLTFRGSFFQVADFISSIDSLVHTGKSKVSVDGRLITLDGFSLSADTKRGFPYLDANFAVTTYVTPPSGVTAGASPTEPIPSPEATTPTGASPEAESTPVASER